MDIGERIDCFKSVLIVFKSTSGLAPKYERDEFISQKISIQREQEPHYYYYYYYYY